MICAYILAGGLGERLWPLSTPEHPKQLLKLFSNKTMIRQTVDRILPLISANRIFVGTNIKQAHKIKKELFMIPEENIIIEPVFKGTAAAIGYAALHIKNKYKDSSMIVLASDHLILDEEGFRKNINIAIDEVINYDTIVTLGVKPTKPETGYGYIEIDGEFIYNKVFAVNKFYEKPNLEAAKSYIKAGRFLWNSGIFIFRTETILEEMKQYMPKHYNILKEIANLISYEDLNTDVIKKLIYNYNRFDKISIDNGIMEKSKRIKVVPSDFGWSDIGSFTSLRDVLKTDPNGNIVKNTFIRQIDSNNNIIISDNLEVGIIGMSNMVLIQSGKRLLVCSADRVQEIKKILM